MDLHFNTDHATTIQLLFYAVTIVSLWHSELFFERDSFKKKWHHSRINIGFIITAIMVQLPLTFFVIKVMQWTAVHHWGILYLIPYHSHLLIKIITGIILLDFFEYLYHVTMHKVSYLWDFHLIHHSDKEFDVSTTVREHPIEIFLRVSM